MGAREAGRTILLVEDHDDTREGYAMFFRRMGFSTAEASSGEKVLAMAEEVLPDVIVMDLGLPGVSGLQVLQELKASAATRSIPVILVSGTEVATARPTGLPAMCLIKPVPPALLLACIEDLVRSGH
jgi:DNA-binding response OmpR family regulator